MRQSSHGTPPSNVIRALLLNRTAYGEADWILSLFTEHKGVIGARAWSGRKSHKRFGGALEPFHTLRVELLERPSSDLATLSSSVIETARLGLLTNLDAMITAGKALSWARRSVPVRTPEPRIWHDLSSLLDRLDASSSADDSRESLVPFGLRLLANLGWGLELDSCVKCGLRCSPRQSAMVSPARGGLICRGCGGARRLLAPTTRRSLLRLSRGEDAELSQEDVETGLYLVESSLQEHAGIDEALAP